MPELAEGTPDGLVNAERVRVLDQRGEEQVERFLRPPARREVAGQGEPGAPVLRIVADKALASRVNPLRTAAHHRELRGGRTRGRRDGRDRTSVSQIAAAPFHCPGPSVNRRG
jgi:hypothetical protein